MMRANLACQAPDRTAGGRGSIPAIATLFLLMLAARSAFPDSAFYESEPNNTPAESNAVTGEVKLYGTMLSGDQDGYLWTVTDDDARKRWNFELYGIPGALTIAEVVRIDYAENGTDVASADRLMKMGTRDGLTPSLHRNQLFEPGEYLIGIAYMGGPSQGGDAMFRPPTPSLSFGQAGSPETADGESSAEDSAEPGAYRFVISLGDTLNVSPNPGPRETRETARAIRPGSEYATFESRQKAWYKFDFDERTAGQRWDIELRVPIGRELRARLTNAGGETLANQNADSHGRIRFSDLAPDVTTWYVELTAPEPGFIHVVTTEAVGQRVEGEEAEPNGQRALANQVDFARPLTGRLGADDSEDYFRFTLDDAMADQLLTLRVESTPPVNMRFCLFTETWVQAQCRDRTTPIELPDLLLAAGDWGLSVARAKDTEYTVSLLPQGAVKPGIEVEPNDTVEFASGVPSNFRIKGQFSGNDTDFFRFTVPDEPQLWRFQVIGEELFEVGYYDGSRSQKAVLRAKTGQRRLRLDDIFLLPGEHYLRVSGRDGGKYALLARALGPPNPDGEIEPNDGLNMQRLAIGQTRSGLLAEDNDTDYYRYFLANWDHIRLTVKPPPDGIVDPDIYWYGKALADGQPGGPGEPMVIEGLFPPGDYHVLLAARQVSAAEYMLSLERLPRFSCPADCEPNGMNQIYLAAPLPADLVLEGKTGEWRDWDYYQLPAFDRPTELLIHTPEPLREMTIGTHHRVRERLAYDAELGGYRTTVPSGVPYRIMLESNGPYRLQLEFPNGPLKAVTESLPVSLVLKFEVDAVSAFRLEGQRVAGIFDIANTGAASIEADLEVATSDYRWRAVLQRDAVSLSAGEHAAVPLDIHVPTDAWADRPVRVSLRARDAAGRQAETWQELGVSRDLAPVMLEPYSAMPDALRGGFNAAWNPFGGEWSEDTEKSYNMEVLRDGLVFPGIRVEWGGDGDGWTEEEKPKWTLDLPGDAALPVAGVAIDHFGTPGAYFDIRKATLLLSEDGSNFLEALRFEALPVETEQQFALKRPMPARYARLRIDSTFQEASTQRLFAAEWKVILEPGFDLSGGSGFDLAAPALGGHVVWDSPPEFYSPVSILADENKSEGAGMNRGPTKDYVIGFYQDRAAQISRIEWRYPPELAERWKNFERVDISASLESPIGPWLPLGEMDLSGAKTIGALELPEPAWARFLRLAAYKRADAQGSHEPGLLRIFERPGGADYHSVLTEWGDTGPRAYYEWRAGIAAESALEASGNTTRDRASPLAIGSVAGGQVSLKTKLQHWYRVAIPAEYNTLTIDLGGSPTVRTVLRMEDAAGNAMALRRIDNADMPGRHRFEAVVEPASEVWLNIAEPPRNVVFVWDTSASVNAYIPLINNSLVAFSGQVVPGQEAVNLMPFSMYPLLEEWYGEPYVLQTVLNEYRRRGSSSSAEWSLKTAAQELAPLPGTKAIVLITDAETPPDGAMWAPMQEVQPRIFGIGVAGSHMIEQHKFRDWTTINGGHYTQLRYEGEMEVAFDRATTLMHRPAGYTLAVAGAYREAPGPGRLRITAAEDAASAGGAAVELILDASGSMLQRMQGKRRIVVAKEVLTEAVRQHIPAGTPVALRVFGHRQADACRTDLEIPLAPLDPDAAASKIAGIQAMNLARTPIADSLAAVRGDLGGTSEGAVVVLVTDGEETCEGDPGAVIESLQAEGFKVNLNIVGFAINDVELAAQFETWAKLAGGRYFAANDQGGLSEALEVALRVPFTVYDRGGNEVAEGEVGGDPVELAQGIYRVEVKSATPRTFDKVTVQGESEVTLELE